METQGIRAALASKDVTLRVESRLAAAKQELARVRRSVELAQEQLEVRELSLRRYEQEVSVLLEQRKAALVKHGETLMLLSSARKELAKLKREYFELYVKPHLPPEVLAEYLRLNPKPGGGGKPPGG
ncbi:MAG: hypothetical protein RI897_3732 [Verrucomicrobiota bacterium]